MTVEQEPLVKINAPEFYKDQAFIDFLNYAVDHPEQSAVATWHTGGEPDIYSDIFITYDHGEGSHAIDGDHNYGDLVPPHIWEQICEKMKAEGITYALLWITNLEK